MRSDLLVKRLFLATSLVLSMGAFFASTPASAATVSRDCTPVEVMDWGTRIHVRCAAAVPVSVDPPKSVTYFALPTSPDSQKAARVISLASTALIAGKALVINFDPGDLRGNDFGCLLKDCRVILTMALKK